MKNTRYKWVKDSPRRYSARIGPLRIGIVRIAMGPLNGLWRTEHIFEDRELGSEDGTLLQVAMLDAEEAATNLLIKTFTALARR